MVPTLPLQLLLVITYQAHLIAYEGNNCYPESHICPFNASDAVNGLVTPTLPPVTGCDHSCQLLECYLTCVNNTSFENIRLYLLLGIHKGRGLQVSTSSKGLTILGTYGQWSPIHLIDFKLSVNIQYFCELDSSQCYPSVYIDNLEASNVEIVIHCYLGSPCSTEIVNSIFSDVSITLSNAVVSLYNIQFHNSTSTALTCYFCRVIINGRVLFVNNTGTNGGAMALTGGSLVIYSEVTFRRNRARQNGGAIYVDTTNELGLTSCFYGTYICSNSNDSIRFEQNSASLSGDHIYGTSLKSTCLDYLSNTPSYQVVKKYFKFSPNLNETLSGISGDPSRVCICQDNFTPQCAKLEKIINREIQVYPGEPFTIDSVIVGGDFGATTGTVYASIESINNSVNSYTVTLEAAYMYRQVISKNRECTKLQYAILSNITGIAMVLILRTSETAQNRVPDNIDELCRRYDTDQVITPELLTTPIVIPLMIQPCPMGFSLQENTQGKCDCYAQVHDILGSARCSINSGHGYISWNASTWLSGIAEGNDSDGIAYSLYCPMDNCNAINELIDLQNNPDAQCAFNHQGRLCGGCKANYSLAIGSSHCIHCSNNYGLSLIIFFAAAGFLLIAAICAFNLTVTAGTINGLVFYANVVWAYQQVLFPQKIGGYLQFLRVFIAWINLDFGIETCFFVGLNAFWKTWLQYLFPMYTAGIFFISLRYSKALSKFLGSRSLHTLATLFFLSNTKLLRTIITALMLAEVRTYPHETTYLVWAVDGTLRYGHFPHILLLLVSILCLVMFWMPYVSLLFSMQWLRRIDHHGPLKYIGKQKPIIDAYFAPLRDKHHYWFGILLLSLSVILVVSSLTLNVVPILSEYLLIVITMLLFWYSNNTRVYKKRYILMIENSFLVNLVLLFVGLQYGIPHPTLMSLSLSITFLEFCGIICWNVLYCLLTRMGCAGKFPQCYERFRHLTRKIEYEDKDESQDKVNALSEDDRE